MEFVQFTTRVQIKDLHSADPAAVFYDTSTNAPMAHDYNFVVDAREFSPFTQYGKIPVPGFNDYSDSVEGIWQGLKIIKGKIDASYFRGKGRKRYGRPSGHLYNGKKTDYFSARKSIYVPAYKFMIEERVPKESLEKIIAAAKSGVKQYFFDVDTNPNINCLKSPVAHSAILVEIINEKLRQYSKIH